MAEKAGSGHRLFAKLNRTLQVFYRPRAPTSDFGPRSGAAVERVVLDFSRGFCKPAGSLPPPRASDRVAIGSAEADRASLGIYAAERVGSRGDATQRLELGRRNTGRNVPQELYETLRTSQFTRPASNTMSASLSGPMMVTLSSPSVAAGPEW